MTRREVELRHVVDLDDIRELCRNLSGSAWIDYRGAASLALVTPALVADLIDLIPKDEETSE